MNSISLMSIKNPKNLAFKHPKQPQSLFYSATKVVNFHFILDLDINQKKI